MLCANGSKECRQCEIGHVDNVHMFQGEVDHIFILSGTCTAAALQGVLMSSGQIQFSTLLDIRQQMRNGVQKECNSMLQAIDIYNTNKLVKSCSNSHEKDIL